MFTVRPIVETIDRVGAVSGAGIGVGPAPNHLALHVASADIQPAPSVRVLRARPGKRGTERSDQPLRTRPVPVGGGLARADIVPFLASLLRIPPDERFPSLDLTPLQQREETFRALREWLWVLSRRHPVSSWSRTFTGPTLHDGVAEPSRGRMRRGTAAAFGNPSPDVHVPFATSTTRRVFPWAG